MKKILTLLAILLPCVLFAQEVQTPEQQIKTLKENIDKQIDRFTDNLQLEDWQVFYADSVLNHDYFAMKDELESLSNRKVENSDHYSNVQDKWEEKIYNAFRKFLTDEQWAKYNKLGAARAKKERDKREAKRNKK